MTIAEILSAHKVWSQKHCNPIMMTPTICNGRNAEVLLDSTEIVIVVGVSYSNGAYSWMKTAVSLSAGSSIKSSPFQGRICLKPSNHSLWDSSCACSISNLLQFYDAIPVFMQNCHFAATEHFVSRSDVSTLPLCAANYFNIANSTSGLLGHSHLILTFLLFCIVTVDIS